VDAGSGEFEHAIKVVRPRAWLSQVQVASQVLRNPFIPGVRPPGGLDPWLPASGAGVVVLAFFGVWFWRRCVGA